MPLRFNERESAVSGNLLLIVLALVSLVLVGVYTVEGEAGPLHVAQDAMGVATTPLRTVGAGIQSAQSSAQRTLEDLNANPETLSELKDQNEQLRQMVSELEEYRQTAQRLEGIQQLRDLYAISGVTCHVIGESGGSWNRIVTIDKGSDDAISAGMPVMGSTGLVGQVKSTSGGTSEVRLLQDPNSGVAVLLQSSRAEGLLKGSIDGLLYLEAVDNDVEVKVGDAVITSGLGGGYFRGLMVGTVVRVEDTNGQSVRRIVVAPNDAVTSLEEVMVVTGIGSEGVLSAGSQQANSASASAGSASGEPQGGSEEGDVDEGEAPYEGSSYDDVLQDYGGVDEEE